MVRIEDVEILVARCLDFAVTQALWLVYHRSWISIIEKTPVASGVNDNAVLFDRELHNPYPKRLKLIRTTPVLTLMYSSRPEYYLCGHATDN